jgi:hypothetical protein
MKSNVSYKRVVDGPFGKSTVVIFAKPGRWWSFPAKPRPRRVVPRRSP